MRTERQRAPARFEAWYGRLLAGEAVAAIPGLRSGLAVHANNAMAAATAALADNFPVVRALLGDDVFADLAQRHARLMPPADPRLCLYGDGFAESLAVLIDAPAFPWLPAMARLEYAVVRALFAADPPKRPRRLSPGRSWPLAPATGWVPSDAPLATLWQEAHQPGADWPDLFPAQAELALVSRVAGAVHVTALPPAAAPLLTALARRTPLARLPAEHLAHLPALAAAGALVPAVGE
jgi:hypothetical protein